MGSNLLQTVWPEWEIVKRIGSGSFGVVYEVVRKDDYMESHAAVKVIQIPQNEAELDSLRSEGLSKDATRTYLQGIVDDFVSEIQLMESFKGTQNVVSIEDYKVVEKQDEIGWNIYIRMELLTPLSTYIADKVLSEDEVIKLGTDICTALELCAKRSIIHRDIKPENIFVNQFGDFKLGDFGIARKLENVTGGMSQKGTYSYMAPEIEKGDQYDATVDLYSLGLVLYRFTNKNRLPFLDTERQILNPNDRAEAVRRRMNGEPLPLPCEASPMMADIILCACQPDPAARFATATAMKNALMNVSAGNQNLDDLNDTQHVRRASEKGDTRTAAHNSGGYTAENQPEYSFGGKKDNSMRNTLVAVIAILAICVVALVWKPWDKADADDGERVEDAAPMEEDAEAEAEAEPVAVRPGVPQNVSATEAAANKALISWQAGDNADCYEVEYYSPKNDEWKTDTDYSSGTSYVSTGLSYYDYYQYRVRSVNSAGASDWVIVTFEKKTTAPLQPGNLQAVSHGSNSVMISWNASSGAKSYEVQYYSRTSGSWQTDSDYSSGTSYVSSGLSYYDTYEYRVRAVNDAGSSDWANCVYYTTYSAPSAPTGLTAEPNGENTARISWNRSNYISYYEVQYYSRKTGSWTADSDYSSDVSTSYVSTGLSSYNSYDYRVRAVNSFGASSWVNVTYTKPSAPSAPTGLWTESLGDGKAQISWNSSAGASYYDVEYFSRKDNAWKSDSDYTGGTSYTTSGLNSYDSYQFRVRAVNSYGAASDWTEVIYYNPDFSAGQ